MLYVSDLIGKPVVDADGQQIGRLQDLVAKVHTPQPHLQIVALVVKKAAKDTPVISMADVSVLVGPAVILARAIKDVTPLQPGDVLWLARDVLDKEIIDTDAARVVRVNDLEVARVNGAFYLANVNIGGLAVLRRLGLMRVAERLARLTGRRIATVTVSWDNIELLPGAQHLDMRFTGGKASDLPAADLADIISDLSPAESTQVVQSLDVERLADTLEEVEPDFQASLVETMTDEKVADLLEEMDPDEAADLLAELPKDRSRDLLELMEEDEAEGVRKLLTYQESSAGGIMTTEFVGVPANLNAGEAIALLRRTAHEAETITYIYVTDSEDHLLGVFSLRELVVADPDTPITQFMHRRLVTVRLSDAQDDVAQAISKYNLVAVPVVDDEQRIHGIVTADDALDKVIPTAWKKRLPRLYH